MTDARDINDLLVSKVEGHDLHDLPPPTALDTDSRIDSSSLKAILAFLNREIDQSARILRDLASHLSDEFCALCEVDIHDSIRQQLIASTIALQNEDRIQQRLGDLRTTLSLLERALHEGNPLPGADLDRVIIDHIKLEEIKTAFAQSVGMADSHPSTSASVKTPSLGDVDLF